MKIVIEENEQLEENKSKIKTALIRRQFKMIKIIFGGVIFLWIPAYITILNAANPRDTLTIIISLSEVFGPVLLSIPSCFLIDKI